MFKVVKTLAERFWEKVDKRGPDECWPWLGSKDWKQRGYLYRDGRLWRAPRIAWMVGNSREWPDGLYALHRCDHPWCVNPAHIFVGTIKDNSADMMAKGRRRGPEGTDHPGSKLNPDLVREMRARHANGETIRDLAEAFGVCTTVTRKAVLRQSWKSVA